MGREQRLGRRTDAAISKGNPPVDRDGCPDFELAPFVKFDPKVVSSDGYNAADAFISSVALVFNDVKGVQWLIRQLEKCRPGDFDVNEAAGQWQGMRLQTTRLTVLILHELLEAIEKAAAGSCLSSGGKVQTRHHPV